MQDSCLNRLIIVTALGLACASKSQFLLVIASKSQFLLVIALLILWNVPPKAVGFLCARHLDRLVVIFL